jgi:hypothetical protein
MEANFATGTPEIVKLKISYWKILERKIAADLITLRKSLRCINLKKINFGFMKTSGFQTPYLIRRKHQFNRLN